MINASLTFSPEYVKKKYTGKTVDRFWLRWNNYKESESKFLRGEKINLCMNNFLEMIIKTLDYHNYRIDVYKTNTPEADQLLDYLVRISIDTQNLP